jgi:hypothetical protein
MQKTGIVTYISAFCSCFVGFTIVSMLNELSWRIRLLLHEHGTNIVEFLEIIIQTKHGNLGA